MVRFDRCKAVKDPGFYWALLLQRLRRMRDIIPDTLDVHAQAPRISYDPLSTRCLEAVDPTSRLLHRSFKRLSSYIGKDVTRKTAYRHGRSGPGRQTVCYAWWLTQHIPDFGSGTWSARWSQRVKMPPCISVLSPTFGLGATQCVFVNGSDLGNKCDQIPAVSCCCPEF